VIRTWGVLLRSPDALSRLPHTRSLLWGASHGHCCSHFAGCSTAAGRSSARRVRRQRPLPPLPARGALLPCSLAVPSLSLLQVRRSSYHDVVKMADVSRYADISGIQGER
jgi:hypothetical protein